MSVAKCAVHFLSSMESSLMILYHATVLLLSCNALVVTLSLPLIFAAVLRRPEITQLYLSVPGTSLRPPLLSEQDSPTWHPWLSEPLSTVDVGVIQMCLCRHPRPSVTTCSAKSHYVNAHTECDVFLCLSLWFHCQLQSISLWAQCDLRHAPLPWRNVQLSP